MRKSLLSIICCMLSVAFTYAQTVYVCSGSTTSKYHLDKNCWGLKRCGSPVKAARIAEMTSQGRSACKICSKGLTSQAGSHNTGDNGKISAIASSTAFNSNKLELPKLTISKQSQIIQHVGYTTSYNKRSSSAGFYKATATKRTGLSQTGWPMT